MKKNVFYYVLLAAYLALLTLASCSSFKGDLFKGTDTGILPYETVRQIYQGDTLETTIGDTVEHYTSGNAFSYNKPLFIQDTSILGLINEHAITEESDPIYSASIAYGITETDTANWNSNSGGTSEIDTSYYAKLDAIGGSIVSSYDSYYPLICDQDRINSIYFNSDKATYAYPYFDDNFSINDAYVASDILFTVGSGYGLSVYYFNYAYSLLDTSFQSGYGIEYSSVAYNWNTDEIIVGTNTGYLISYTVDGWSGGETWALTYTDSRNDLGSYAVIDIAWQGSNNVYFIASYSGIATYGLNGSGTLSYIDNDNLGGYYKSVDNDDNFVYATSYEYPFGNYLYSYAYDASGNLTFADSVIYTYDYASSHSSITVDKTYGYILIGGYGHIFVYSSDESGNLTHVYTYDFKDSGLDDMHYITDLDTYYPNYIFTSREILTLNSDGSIDFYQHLGFNVTAPLGSFSRVYGLYDPVSSYEAANKNYVDLHKILSGSLTDNVPTASEIEAVTGVSASDAGSGYWKIIHDSDGTGLLYKVESNGSSWFYTAMTQAQ